MRLKVAGKQKHIISVLLLFHNFLKCWASSIFPISSYILCTSFIYNVCVYIYIDTLNKYICIDIEYIYTYHIYAISFGALCLVS